MFKPLWIKSILKIRDKNEKLIYNVNSLITGFIILNNYNIKTLCIKNAKTDSYKITLNTCAKKTDLCCLIRKNLKKNSFMMVWVSWDGPQNWITSVS